MVVFRLLGFLACHLRTVGGTGVWRHTVCGMTSTCRPSGPESWASSPSAPTVAPCKPPISHTALFFPLQNFFSVGPSAGEALPFLPSCQDLTFLRGKVEVPLLRREGVVNPPRSVLFCPCCVRLEAFRLVSAIPVFVSSCLRGSPSVLCPAGWCGPVTGAAFVSWDRPAWAFLGPPAPGPAPSSTAGL